ncbi:MAG: site-specific integrase [Acidobacteria bacterium]|nr:site-specific integrase [Acidobacteriota bacterium]
MGKRGQNEGSIYKRADGRWAGAISLGYKDGKQKRKTFYGDTRKEVQEQVTSALRDIQKGLPPVTESQTLGEFLDFWLEKSVKPSLRPATYSSYQILVKTHIKPTLEQIKLIKLSPQHLQTLMQEKLSAGLSTRTVQYLRAILRRALNQAIKWGLVSRNVAGLVDPPRSEKKEIKPWTLEQSKKFLEVCAGHRLEALFVLTLSLGLRRGEVLGLRWEEVDFQKKSLKVKLGLQRIDGKLILGEVKTKKSARTLPLPDSLVSLLKSHRAKQLEEKLAIGSKWKESNLVFTTSIGTPIEPRNLKRSFDKILEDANKKLDECHKLPHQRIHDLRHTCATLLLAQGVPPRTIMEILGHSVISTTLDVYAHVLPEMNRDAINTLEFILGNQLDKKAEKTG